MKHCNLLELYKKLYTYFGPQHWWPAQTKFEVCVGAILTQNTAWQNVEKAIANLKKVRKLSLQGMLSLSEKELAGLIRSAGYYNQKAKRLKLFCEYVKENYNGSLRRFFNKSLDELRKELLSLHGIGSETADSIILYAAEKPSFVIDAYTVRIIERVYNIRFKSRTELKQFFENRLPKDTKLYNEYHALLVELAKNFCKKKPLCDKCPINKKCYYYKIKVAHN
jgi:endonuclease-3 related protein